MGLSAPKQKQRLVGSASTRNTAWLNDASAPGQRMMAQMGWTTGQSLGSSMTGLTENLKVAYKMDNKGIGAQRHEREAKADGKDVWVGGGGDLGSLFDRINAANAVPTTAEEKEEDVVQKGKGKQDKKDKKSRSREKENGKDEPSKKKRKTQDEPSRDITDRQLKREAKANKKDKKLKKSAAVSEAISTLIDAEPTLSKDPTAVEEIKQDAIQGRPIRMAHRAKFLRAKRMVSASDLASVNEILGIASTPSSSTPGTPRPFSGTATPAVSSKKYPGPGGAEIQLMDVDKRLNEEADMPSKTSSETKKEKKEKKEKKTEKKEKKTKKIKDGREKRPKESRKADDELERSEARAVPTNTHASASDMEEEKDTDKQIGTNTQGLHVFEYLNRRLMLRKAQIARRKKAEHEAIFTRAAAIGA